MNKKFVSILLFTTVASVFVVGCASDGGSPRASHSDALPTPATPPPGAPAPASAAHSAPVVAAAPVEEIHNPAAPAVPVATEKYVVKSGDSLWKIARDRKTSVVKLKELNHLTGDVIKAGDEIVVPVLK